MDVFNVYAVVDGHDVVVGAQRAALAGSPENRVSSAAIQQLTRAFKTGPAARREGVDCIRPWQMLHDGRKVAPHAE